MISRDLMVNWHPCSLRKNFESFKPLMIKDANGSYVTLADGRKLIDATSSWWCKSLGHNHPRLKEALIQQMDKFEHVIFAYTTYENIIQLSEKLVSYFKTLNKVYYASDGASAIEMALKMSLLAQMNKGQKRRNQFITLKNSYHGETIGALSVTNLDLYRKPYESLAFDVKVITPIYVDTKKDPLWQNCGNHWKQIEEYLETIKHTVAAVIIEPMVQGAAGMEVYSQDFVKRLRHWTQAHGIFLIADEIMTGVGRLGRMFACEYANIEPDFLCLGKGLTSGWLPLSAVLLTNEVYDLLCGHDLLERTFLHSHTFAGNALAASVALETLKVIEEESICKSTEILELIMQEYMIDIAKKSGALTHVRGIGGIVAADLIHENSNPSMGFEIFKQGINYGILLRSLGRTLYWLPPLNISHDTLKELKDRTHESIMAALNKQ